jgi:hypothetical protein
MDNIEPDQAADLLAGDYSQPIEKSFGRLVDLMAESSIPAHAEAEYENYRSQLDGKSLDAAIRAVHELLGVPVAVAQEPHRPYFSELSIGIEDEQGTDMRLE